MLNFIIFIISIIIFLITVKLFYTSGIAADELGVSFSDLIGGDFEVSLSWYRLFLSFILTVLTLINLLLKLKKWVIKRVKS